MPMKERIKRITIVIQPIQPIWTKGWISTDIVFLEVGAGRESDVCRQDGLNVPAVLNVIRAFPNWVASVSPDSCPTAPAKTLGGGAGLICVCSWWCAGELSALFVCGGVGVKEVGV